MSPLADISLEVKVGKARSDTRSVVVIATARKASFTGSWHGQCKVCSQTYPNCFEDFPFYIQEWHCT